ncbi:Uncharacterised protein [Vibrio cholerae]|nr:Uncharacterised protein [Vibrio cholerae]
MRCRGSAYVSILFRREAAVQVGDKLGQNHGN